MLVYLDTNVVIYLVEGTPRLGDLARVRLAELKAGGHVLTVSHLVRMEARIGALKSRDDLLLAEYDLLFREGGLHLTEITGSVFDTAARIRAEGGYATPDALHLAAAVGGGCEAFLTNDGRLQGFEELKVEVLD